MAAFTREDASRNGIVLTSAGQRVSGFESTVLPGVHPTETINGEIMAHAIATPAPAVQTLHTLRFALVNSCCMKRKTEHLVKLIEMRRRMRLEKTSWFDQ
jgi:hypothetical protein